MNPGAAQEVHETLVSSTDLYSNIVAAAGEYDAKVDSTANSSLAAHILNAVTIGVNTYVYEAVDSDTSVLKDETERKRVLVLAAALALHDTNKFVREAYGVDVDGNTEEAFEWYFEPPATEDGEPRQGDPFGIEALIGEGYREDLRWLVQRTELTEDSSETRASVRSRFKPLQRYCRIGDTVASVALREGVDGVHRQLSEMLSPEDVQALQLTQLEQPVLNDTLLAVTKQVIAGETENEASGVILGSSPDTIVYLGDPVDSRELRDAVSQRAPELIANEFEFNCKLNWNSFEYDILEEVAIPVEEKEDKITQAFRELLEGGSAGVEPFEHIPPEFDPYFPVLAKAIYVDGQSEFHDPSVQEAYDRIKEEQGVQKVKLHFVAYLVQHNEEHTDFLERFADELRPELHDDLEPEADAIGTVVDRFFDGRTSAKLGPKEEMCFLCGAETDTKYKKGLSAVYRTQEYSRRVPPHAKYKSICEVCNLEYALFSHVCERNGVSTNNSVELAYFYFDDFLGDVRVRKGQMGNIVQGDGDELDDPEVRSSLVGPQYFLQPMYVLDENHRMMVVRQVMQAAQESGMKVVIGRPFTRFESADTVFTDEEATRPQELLGLDAVERFGPVPDFVSGPGTDSHFERALQLFKIMSMVGQEANLSNQYLHLDRDKFHSIADFAVTNHDNATRLSDLREYFEAYHEQEFMDMQTIAERGIDLFGKQFDSKYKKTKVFREALDAFLSGQNQGMGDEQLIDYVESQVYALADREDYAGHVTPDQTEAFVSAIRTYLVENDLDDLKKLSDWEDALVNSYYYAYDQTVHDY